MTEHQIYINISADVMLLTVSRDYVQTSRVKIA